MVENPPANAGDLDLSLGPGRALGEWNGNPLQYSCWEKPLDREAWQATVRGVAKELDTTEVTEQQQQRRGRGAGGGTGWKEVRRYYKLPIVRYTSTRNIMNMKNIISTAVHSTWKLLLVSNEKEQKNTYYVFSLRCKNIENSYMMIEIRKSLPLVSETVKNWLEGCMREFSRVIKTLHILFCLVVTTVRTYQTEHLRFDHVIAYKVYCN